MIWSAEVMIYHFKFLKGCLPEIWLGSYLNTLSHIVHWCWLLYHFIAKFLDFKGVFIACKKSFYSFNVFPKRWLSFKTQFKIEFLLPGTSSWKVLGIIPAYVHKFPHGFNFASKVLLVLFWKFHLKQFSDTSQKLQNFIYAKIWPCMYYIFDKWIFCMNENRFFWHSIVARWVW